MILYINNLWWNKKSKNPAPLTGCRYFFHNRQRPYAFVTMLKLPGNFIC